MNMSRLLFASFLILTSLWWGWTFLVDFFVIRTVFSTITSFFQAGDLGIAVFSKLNNLEVIVSSMLLGILSFRVVKFKKSFVLFGTALVVWIVAMTYFTYLTPKLIELTELWKKTDLMGITAVHGIPDIQQEHQFFHNLYIKIDAVKFLILTFMLGWGLFKERSWS